MARATHKMPLERRVKMPDDAARAVNLADSRRNCAYCRGPIVGKRRDAKFCCNSHRVMYGQRVDSPSPAGYVEPPDELWRRLEDLR